MDSGAWRATVHGVAKSQTQQNMQACTIKTTTQRAVATLLRGCSDVCCVCFVKSASSEALERPVATSSPVLRVVTCQPRVTGRGHSHAGLQVSLPLPPPPSPLPGQNLLETTSPARASAVSHPLVFCLPASASSSAQQDPAATPSQDDAQADLSGLGDRAVKPRHPPKGELASFPSLTSPPTSGIYLMGPVI